MSNRITPQKIAREFDHCGGRVLFEPLMLKRFEPKSRAIFCGVIRFDMHGHLTYNYNKLTPA
jgi:hypothetical protein